MKNLRFVFLTTLLLLTSFVYATEWVNSDSIKELADSLKIAKEELKFKDMQGKDVPASSFVTFPTKIPALDEPLYGNLKIFEQNSEAIIHVGISAGCSNKFCFAITLNLDANKNPEIIYDNEKKQVSEPVKLHHNIQGLYNREHALASTFPPSIVWRDGAVRYTLTIWKWKLSKDEIIGLANDMIDNLHGKSS